MQRGYPPWGPGHHDEEQTGVLQAVSLCPGCHPCHELHNQVSENRLNPQHGQFNMEEADKLWEYLSFSDTTPEKEAIILMDRPWPCGRPILITRHQW